MPGLIKNRWWLLGALALFLAGCASYENELVPGKSLAGLHQFFVLSNLNDNHAIDRQIATALRQRGLAADVGPRTMMPDQTQVIVTYQDHWAWDFGDHLVYLTINVRDALSNEPIAAITFQASVPLREPVPVTVNRLVDQLFSGKKP